MIPPYHSESHTLRFNWNKEASLSIWDKHLFPASSHASFHGKNSVSTSCLNHLLHICNLSSAVIWEEGDLTAWEFVAQSWHWSEMFMAAVHHSSTSTTRAIWSQQLDELSVLQVEETQMIYSRCQCITPVSRLLCPLRMMRGTKVTICLGRCAWRGLTWRLDDNSRGS